MARELTYAAQPSREDLTHIMEHARPLFEQLRGQRLFLTGGTGFIGRWLLHSLAFAVKELKLDVEVVALTRSKQRFAERDPVLAEEKFLSLWEGDVLAFGYPHGEFKYVIHGAVDASATLNRAKPELVYSTITAGTKRVLDLAKQANTKRLLFLSSGAVYSEQSEALQSFSEDLVIKSGQSSAYSEGKRVAELECLRPSGRDGFEAVVARCFAFVGPYLPLDGTYAIGNFIADVLSGRDIEVKGDGTPIRSYLYAADLVVWLWTILLKGRPGGIYNVGSDDTRSIAQVADLVAATLCPAGSKPAKVLVRGQSTIQSATSRYVPDITLAKKELNLAVWTGLADAIQRTGKAIVGAEVK